MTVLCFAAHPDDELLGPGATLARHLAEGDLVIVSIRGRCRQPDWSVPKRAAQMLGYGLAAGDIHSIEDLLDIYRPDIVYTHHAGDLNREHRELHERVLVACRPYTAPYVRSIRTFDTASSTEWGLAPFTPNLFVDVTPYIARKLEAMAEYASELRPHPHPRGLNTLSSRAAYWGSVSGYEYAEPFMVVRERW